MKDLLIIGAGPYGLATAAHAKDRGLDLEVVGKPMGLWRDHMPKGMILRTSKDEHFDVAGPHTMDAFMAERGLKPGEMTPLPLAKYLDYADWFVQKKGLQVTQDVVLRLDSAAKGFRAKLMSGRVIDAKNVIVAIGVRDFKHVPDAVAELVPAGRFSHSSDHAEFGTFKSRRVLIVGGRQSAFETAAILAEEGAAAVHVAFRHDTPAFTRCDFSFMQEIIQNIVRDPAWYRNLPKTEAEKWSQLAFQQGRLKLEHWLEPRLKEGKVRIHERVNVRAAKLLPDQSLEVTLDSGATVLCDHIIFATGFKPDISKVPFLQQSNFGGKLEVKDGSPRLDTGFQSSVSGLYFLGMLSVADFGFSFGFATAATTAATLVVRALHSR